MSTLFQRLASHAAPIFPQFLTSEKEKPSSPATATVLACHSCNSHLCTASGIISRTFTGRHGRAFLLDSNALSTKTIVLQAAQERVLVTGVHTVRDFACRVCGADLGWRYDAAQEEDQRYKVGKWILERERVRRVAGKDVVEEEIDRLLQE